MIGVGRFAGLRYYAIVAQVLCFCVADASFLVKKLAVVYNYALERIGLREEPVNRRKTENECTE